MNKFENWFHQSDSCLIKQASTKIIVTTPNDSQQSLNCSEDGGLVSNRTSPRSCISANNLYSLHRLNESSSSIGGNFSNSSLGQRNASACACRKCSLFDDCDAKEAKTVMKYLRFRKVVFLIVQSQQQLSQQQFSISQFEWFCHLVNLFYLQFKRMLNKELSHFSESKSGNQISEYICNTFLGISKKQTLGICWKNNSIFQTSNKNAICQFTMLVELLRERALQLTRLHKAHWLQVVQEEERLLHP